MRVSNTATFPTSSQPEAWCVPADHDSFGPTSSEITKPKVWPGWPQDEPAVRTQGKKLWEARMILGRAERQWLYIQPWLQSQGYLLRSRFRPDWTPSWNERTKDIYRCEDSITHSSSAAIDAIQIATGRLVCLKRVPIPADTSTERAITEFLSSDGRQSDSRNHSIPLLDVIRAPDHCFLVFPLYRTLLRMQEKFTSVGEGLDFIEQTLEGLAYLHELGIAHRDCALSNIVMDADAMFPRGFHPDLTFKDAQARNLRGVRSRTHVGGVKYYLIDFGESMKFDSTENVRIDVWSKASIHAPETLDDDRPPYDPFKVDVWAMGTTYTEVVLEGYPGYFDTLSGLLEAMSSDDPNARPSAQDALTRLRDIKSQYSRTGLHSRVRHKSLPSEMVVQRAFRGGWHWLKQLAFAARNRKW